MSIKQDCNLKIMEILERQGVSVAFPSRSIYFENAMPEPGTPVSAPPTADTGANGQQVKGPQ